MQYLKAGSDQAVPEMITVEGVAKDALHILEIEK
jgi:hypothetical protein